MKITAFITYQRNVRELKKEAVFEDVCEQQAQSLEEIRCACEVSRQVWNKAAGAEGNGIEDLA